MKMNNMEETSVNPKTFMSFGPHVADALKTSTWNGWKLSICLHWDHWKHACKLRMSTFPRHRLFQAGQCKSSSAAQYGINWSLSESKNEGLLRHIGYGNRAKSIFRGALSDGPHTQDNRILSYSIFWID